MTAVPGAPRRFLLPSSPRRGAPGPFATLALISVGLRLMGTLRVRTWQLWGARTADCRCIIIMIIRTSPPRFQDSRLSYSRDSSRIPTLFVLHCFANPVPAGPCQVRSTDSIADNSGQFHRKSADFSRNVANVHMLATRRRDAFLVSSSSSSAQLERRRLGGSDIFKYQPVRRRRSSPGAFSAPFLRRTLSTRPRKLRSKTKPGLCGRALHRRRNDALLYRGDLPELALERLVGLPGEVGIKLAELGRLRHKALVGALGVVGLHLDRLFERLRANEFLGRGGALLEHLLGIVRDLVRDRLQSLRKRAKRLQRRIHVVLTQLLDLVDIPNHVLPLPAASPFACDFPHMSPASQPD